MPFTRAENKGVEADLEDILGLVDPVDAQQSDTCLGLELRGDC